MANVSKFTRKRLGEILVNEGLVSTKQIQEALEAQGNTGEMLGETLVRLGYITEEKIASTLCDQFQLPFIVASSYDIPKEMAKQIPVQYMLDHLFVPLDSFNKVMVVAMAGMLNQEVVGEIEQITGCEVQPFIATMGDVRKSLERLFPHLFQLGPSGASVRGIGYTEAIGHTEGIGYATAEAALDDALPEGDGKQAVEKADKPAVEKAGKPAAREGNSGNSGNSKRKKPSPPAARPPARPAPAPAPAVEEEDDTWESLFDAADESVRKDLGS